jgi:hypothetical protein
VRLIDSIKHLIKGEEGKPEVRQPLRKSDMQLIWENPGDYNRATRRRAGIRIPVGLLSEQHVGLTVSDDPVGIIPRYARRHLASMTGPRTRRNRRHLARIKRQLEPRGLWGVL